MYVVGLTGGIGSGKSAVSHHLEHKGIAVVDADGTYTAEGIVPGEYYVTCTMTSARPPGSRLLLASCGTRRESAWAAGNP